MNCSEVFNPAVSLNPLSKATENKSQKLIYRGLIYDYIPKTVQADRSAIVPSDKTIQLIYRGLTYKNTISLIQSYRKPRAMNWRFKVS